MWLVQASGYPLRTKNLSGAAADRIQGCFRLTAALLRGVAAQNDENLISRAPPAPFPGIGEKCGLADHAILIHVKNVELAVGVGQV